MDLPDIITLSRQLYGLYAERFPGLTPDLSRLWLEALRSVDPEVMDQALTRWARQHHIGQAPTLQNLLDTVELVEEDHRAIQAARRPPTSHTTPGASIYTLLEHAAALQNGTARTWAHGHCEILERGLGRPSNHPETAAFCRLLATRHPELAESWEREACWWESHFIT